MQPTTDTSEALGEPSPRSRRRRWLIALPASALLAAGGVAVVTASSPGASRPRFGFSGANASFNSVDAQGGTIETTEPGPEASTLKLVTYKKDSLTDCVQIQDSEGPGQSLDPSKPPGNVGNCGTASINPGLTESPPTQPTYGVVYDNEGALWISQKGNRYMVAFGRVVSRVAQVSYTYPDGAVLEAAVRNGWWTVAIPPDSFQTGFVQSYSDAAGNVIVRLGPNGQVCQSSQACK
jgi:hypothetical protein